MSTGKIKKKIARVVVSLSSPWFTLKTKEVRITKEQDFSINSLFIKEILSSEEKIFKTELAQKFAGNTEDSFNVIDRSMVYPRINGYPVQDFLGKSAKDFEVSLCMTAVAKTLEDKVINIISKNTHIERDKIMLYSFSIVMFSMIRDYFAEESNFMLMDITNEVTDITIVKNDIITDTASFPCGRNFMIHQIAKASDISTEIALSSVYMYMQSKTHDAVSKKLEELIENSEKEWAIYLEDTLHTLSPDMIFPRNLYITASSDTAPLFMGFLRLPKADSTTDFRKNIHIVHINDNNLSSFYDSESKMIEDEFIAILAIFCNKMFQV